MKITEAKAGDYMISVKGVKLFHERIFIKGNVYRIISDDTNYIEIESESKAVYLHRYQNFSSINIEETYKFIPKKIYERKFKLKQIF